ncbi:MAG: MBL fold metallo-hydrolase [Anaerolineaceae bacterium]|nr:MBL fold metallo-hydrolase [Anaerolineaceae bacterium]
MQTQIVRKTCKAVDAYPQTWKELISDWGKDSEEDAVWLTYAANYLFRTAGVHWGLDPFSLSSRIGKSPQPNFRQDLAPLKLIVLSHHHNDHFDPILLTELQCLPITWVIPKFILESVKLICNLPDSRIIIPEPGVPLVFDELVLTPFNALHFHGNYGVPEMGYLAEFSGKRWLFTGDTRSFEAKGLPEFGALDGVMAHCWLGKDSALEPKKEFIGAFCKLFGSFNSKKIVISHLQEYGRSPDNFWTLEHFRMLKRGFIEMDPKPQVVKALLGDKILL